MQIDISPLKKRIIIFLFCLAIIALAANVIIDKIFNDSDSAVVRGLDANSVNKEFLNDLNKFGLKSDWIVKVNNKISKGIPSYNVELPKDLPIPVVLSEVYASFYSPDIKIKSLEKTIGGKTELQIYLQNTLKLRAEFNYGNDIRRDAGNLGIIVFGLEQLNAKDLTAMIEFPQTFITALIPSKSAVKLIPDIIDNRKEYAILINDKISDLDYRLNNDFSLYRLKLIIRSIIGTFPDAVFFIIDDHSSLYSSSSGKIICDEFTKRNIKLIKESLLPEILNDSRNEQIGLFRNNVEKIHFGSSKLISIRAEDFRIIKPEIFSLIKVGYKFISPSVIIAADYKNYYPN
ncbi:MAG: hypothetical protein WCA84_10375 [Ignavibacteriaceae bacterium]|jgi:hypothetical protein